MGSEAGVQFDTNCGGDRLLLGRVEPPEMRAVPVGPFSACLFALDMQLCVLPVMSGAWPGGRVARRAHQRAHEMLHGRLQCFLPAVPPAGQMQGATPPAMNRGRRNARDHLVDGLPTKERPPRTKFGLEPMSSFTIPGPTAQPSAHGLAHGPDADLPDEAGPAAHRLSAQVPAHGPDLSELTAAGPTAHATDAGPAASVAAGPAAVPIDVSSFSSWHVGQFAYGHAADVTCLVCNVTFSRGLEASHGTGRRHAREFARQSLPEVHFCPGRAGAWGCHCFCRCGRFWPRGSGERPHLHFRVAEKVSRPDYEEELGGDSFEQGHRIVCAI
jgi:hypothetical protein